MTKHRSGVHAAVRPIGQVAAMANLSGIERDRLIRTALVVGPRGRQLGLDEVLGIVWCRITDHGAPGVHMPAGHALVEVWGGSAADVFGLVLSRTPPGLTVVVRWREARRWHRALRWLVFARWRLAEWKAGRR